MEYQLSKSEGTDPVFYGVYEGTHRAFTVSELKPLTKYRFRLRWRPEDTDQWSSEYKECSGTTEDETAALKAVRNIQMTLVNGDGAATMALIERHKADLHIEARDRYDRTLLMLACQYATGNVVQCLMNLGPDVKAATRSGKTAISFAVTYGNLEAVRILLDFDEALVNQRDQGGSTILMWAAENAHANKQGHTIVELLLSRGANVQAVDNAGQTALDRIAVLNGHAPTAQLLIKHGGLLRLTPDRKQPMTTLMTAALNGHVQLVRCLLADYDVPYAVANERGATALTYASSGDHTSVIKAIRDHMDKKVARAPAADAATGATAASTTKA
ncbi:hypothetical protein CXG81DRAFT_29841 [Caulochytrium protostelioides]|uniref:Uncharacterized protein n=1 Tax=Caulochytrium protostelioides TaxID=1555241 RepID=A0A4P9X745_9FUNG|nr:hypothetical protein CXG81DRAFT_29841 [Caulochytrium protostelioides]|eukprot:RKP01046.1 hypothetical protein CXG81DRAFT_29841 [Caulochytrium protostelioides]